ncbi:MAG: hypothetical protein ABH830_04720, partial [Patescibacteria group bacterium]
MIERLEKEKQTEAQSSKALVLEFKQKIISIDEKLDKLLDSHLENIISKEDYVSKKEKLINEKLSLQEKIKEIQDKGSNWLEPMRDFILTSKLAKKTAYQGDLKEIRAFLKNIGSNFILKGKKFAFLPHFEWNLAFLIKAHPCWLPIKNIFRTLDWKQISDELTLIIQNNKIIINA